MNCDGSGEIRWLTNPPDPQTEESAPCPGCPACLEGGAASRTHTYAGDAWPMKGNEVQWNRPERIYGAFRVLRRERTSAVLDNGKGSHDTGYKRWAVCDLSGLQPVDAVEVPAQSVTGEGMSIT